MQYTLKFDYYISAYPSETNGVIPVNCGYEIYWT